MPANLLGSPSAFGAPHTPMLHLLRLDDLSCDLDRVTRSARNGERRNLHRAGRRGGVGALRALIDRVGPRGSALESNYASVLSRTLHAGCLGMWVWYWVPEFSC